MVEHEGLTAYLSFPADRMTRGILLQEQRRLSYLVAYKGRIVEISDSLPKRLLEDMRERGAIITPRPVTKLIGKSNLFGVNATSLYDGVDTIRIRVVGEDLNDMVLKIQQIKTSMSKFGYEPKQCVWDRVGRFA